MAIKSLHLSGGRKVSLIQNIKDKLNALKLDGDEVDGLTYVSKFILENNKLEQMNAKLDDLENMTSFYDNIEDPNFETVQQLLKNILLESGRENTSLNVREFYDIVEDRQRSINKRAEVAMEKNARHATYKKSSEKEQSSSNSNKTSIDFNLP